MNENIGFLIPEDGTERLSRNVGKKFIFFNSLPIKMGPIGLLETSVRNQLLGLLTLVDGTNRLSRNVGKKLPLLAA